MSARRRKLHDRLASFPNEVTLQQEREISAHRRELHAEIDALKAERSRRRREARQRRRLTVSALYHAGMGEGCVDGTPAGAAGGRRQPRRGRPLGEAHSADAALGAPSTLRSLVLRLVSLDVRRVRACAAAVEHRGDRRRHLHRRHPRQSALREHRPPRGAEPDPDRQSDRWHRVQHGRHLHPDRKPRADGQPLRADDPLPRLPPEREGLRLTRSRRTRAAA